MEVDHTGTWQKEAERWYDNDGILSSPFITEKEIRKTSVSHNSLT